MDPNKNLEEQLDCARRILSGDYANMDYHAERLAELVEALDGWITGGGFWPERWAKQLPPATWNIKETTK